MNNLRQGCEAGAGARARASHLKKPELELDPVTLKS